MIIRKATQEDVRRISYLIRKNTENVLENNYSPAQIAIWKKANSPKQIEQQLQYRTIFCAFHKERLIGTIGLQDNEVVGFYVSFSKRKLGIGTKLLTHLEDYAQHIGLASLTLTSTPSALKFYQSQGYKPLGTVIVKIMGIPFKETTMEKKF